MLIVSQDGSLNMIPVSVLSNVIEESIKSTLTKMFVEDNAIPSQSILTCQVTTHAMNVMKDL